MQKFYFVTLLFVALLFAHFTASACTVGGRVWTKKDTICKDSSAFLYLSGHDGIVKNWQYSDDGGATWKHIVNTKPYYGTMPTTENRLYRAVVEKSGCPIEFSAPVSIVIGKPVEAGILNHSVVSVPCGGNIMFEVTGYKGKVVGWEVSEWGCGTPSFISSSSATYHYYAPLSVPASMLPMTNCIRAKVVDACGNEAWTPISNIIILSPAPSTLVLKTSVDSLCLGEPLPIELEGYDGRMITWWGNVVNSRSDVGGKYAMIETPCGTDSLSMMLEFITKVSKTDFSLDPLWGGKMYSSEWWYWYEKTFGTAPAICIEVLEGTSPMYCTPKTNRITIPIKRPAKGGAVSADRMVCSGNSPGPLNLFEYYGSIIRWESSTDGGASWLPIAHTDKSYTPGPITTETCFRAIVKQGTCSEQPSSPAKIKVTPAPEGGNLFGDDELCWGEDSTFLQLENHKGQIKYWEYSTDGGSTWTKIQHIASNLVLGPMYESTIYRVTVGATGCPDVLSTPFEVKVRKIPNAIGGNAYSPKDKICAAECATILLENHVGEVIRWEKSVNCDPFSWTSIDHAGQTSLNLCGLGVAGCCDVTPISVCFRALLATDLACKTQYSSTLKITIDNKPCLPPPGGGGSGGTCECDCQKPKCVGEVATIRVKDYKGTIIGWEYAPTADTALGWTPIAFTGDLYTTPSLTVSSCYRAVVEDGGTIYRSKPVCIEVKALPEGGIAEFSKTICTGEDSGPIKLRDYFGEVFNWIYTTDDIVWDDAPFSDGKDVYISPRLMKTTKFKALVRACGHSRYSSTVTITVAPDVKTEGGYIEGSTEVCSGSGTTLTLKDFFGSIIRWESSTNGFFTVTTIANTTPTLATGPLSIPTSYRAIVKSGVCNEEKSATFRVNIYSTIGGYVSSPSLTVCSGKTLDLELVGSTGDVINWEASTDGGTSWASIPVTTKTYTTAPLTTDIRFRANSQIPGCNVATSSVVSIKVLPSARKGKVTADQTVCSGEVMLSFNLTDYDGRIIRWESSTDGGSTWKSIDYVYSSYSSKEYVTASKKFRAVTYVPGCDTQYSDAANLTVNPGPDGGILKGGYPVCGTTAVADLRLDGYDGTIVRWEKRNEFHPSWTSVAHTGDSYKATISSTYFDKYYYRVVVQKGSCPEVYSSIAAFEFYPEPKSGILFGDQTTCSGDVDYPLNLVSYYGLIKRWESSTDGGVTWTPIAHKGERYSPTGITATTQYRVLVGFPGCLEVYSNTVTVKLTPGVSVGRIVATSTCISSPVTMKADGASGRILYWETSTDGGATWTRIPHTAHVFRTSIITTPTMYRYVMACRDTFSTVTSPAISITPGASAGTLTASETSVCSGTPVTFNLTGATGTLLFESSSDCFATSGVATAVSSWPYTFTPMGTACYRVIASSGSCPPETTAVVTVTVNPPAARGRITGDKNACSGGSGKILNIEGYSGTITRWESSTSCFTSGTPVDLGHSGSETLNTGSLTTSTCFRAVIHSTCGTVYSPVHNITVYNPTAIATYVFAGGCSLGDNDIVTTVVGGSGSYNFSIDPAVRPDNSTGVFSNPPAGLYNIIVTDLMTGCVTSTFVEVKAVSDDAYGKFTDQMVTQYSALLKWSGVSGGGVLYNVRYRIKGTTEWMYRTGIDISAIALVDLQHSTEYEVELQVICPSGTKSDWIAKTTFTTTSAGDCFRAPYAKPGGIHVSDLTPRSATIKWNPVPGAKSYIIQIGLKGSPMTSWITQTVCAPAHSFVASMVMPGRSYEYRVQTNCLSCGATSRGGLSTWSNVYSFTTPFMREAVEEQVYNPSALSIYPNPNKGDFQLSFSTLTDEAISLALYDLNGRVIWANTLTPQIGENTLPVHLEGVAAGIYVLRFNQSSVTESLKVVID